jgi:anti-sigma B factor antagonist
VERSSGAAPPRQLVGSEPNTPADGHPLQIQVERLNEGLCRIALTGELDLGTSPKLEDLLLDELASNEGVILDLTRLSFIDSSGIGLLIKAHQAKENGVLLHTVVSPESQVERVFAIAGIGRALPLFFDRDEAVAAAGPPSSQDGAS